MIENTLENYHRQYDIYHTYEGINNLKTINDHAGIDPVVVDAEIMELLLFSKEMYEKTNGKTNIAMGSVLALWSEYKEIGQTPPWEKLMEASNYVNIDQLVLNEEENTVYLESDKMRLDVGAVAKGFAVEKIGMLLEEQGIEHALISAGGNVKTIGTKPDGSEWKIGIQNPDLQSENPYVKVVSSKDNCLITSGIYQRFFEVEGVRYHHIIDPDRLIPAKGYQSISVIYPDSGVADSFSTALFNMSVEDGMKIVEKVEGMEVYWILEDGTYAETSGFSAYSME